MGKALRQQRDYKNLSSPLSKLGMLKLVHCRRWNEKLPCYTKLFAKIIFSLMSILFLNELQTNHDSSEVIWRLRMHKVRVVLEIQWFSWNLMISIKLYKYTRYFRVGTTFLPYFHMAVSTKGTWCMHETSLSFLLSDTTFYLCITDWMTA